jgi:hypothetical protein
MADEGRWPRALRRFCCDFLPAGVAPINDGVVAPNIPEPDWIASAAEVTESLDLVRRARESAEERARTAEDKASRLLQTVLALLTLALALGSYQATFASGRASVWFFTLIPIGYAIGSLALSAFEASQIDRVGLYYMPDGSELEGASEADVRRTLLVAEDRGRQLADWTARKKHSDLMQARAWMTRGLAALLLAALLAAGARASSEAKTSTPEHAKSPPKTEVRQTPRSSSSP